MLQAITEYVNMLFNNYLFAIFIVCGAFLIFFEVPSTDPEKFSVEKKIAKIVGIGYILFGIGMYILSLFIK